MLGGELDGGELDGGCDEGGLEDGGEDDGGDDEGGLEDGGLELGGVEEGGEEEGGDEEGGDEGGGDEEGGGVDELGDLQAARPSKAMTTKALSSFLTTGSNSGQDPSGLFSLSIILPFGCHQTAKIISIAPTIFYRVMFSSISVSL